MDGDQAPGALTLPKRLRTTGRSVTTRFFISVVNAIGLIVPPVNSQVNRHCGHGNCNVKLRPTL